MSHPDNQSAAIEAQLDMLRTATSGESAQRVREGIDRRIKTRRRIVALAAAGALVSALATAVFIMKKDPFGYFALALTTFVMAVVAWKSANWTTHNGLQGTGIQMLEVWRKELRQQLRHTLLAQLIAVQFTGLAGWVVWLHGLVDGRALLYVITALVIWTFALYQWLVVRPALRRELAAINDPQ